MSTDTVPADAQVFTLSSIAQQLNTKIVHPTYGEEAFIGWFKEQYAGITQQLESARKQAALQRLLNIKLKKAKDLQSQWIAYRMECERVARLIQEEKAEKKRIKRQESKHETRVFL